MPRRNTGPRLRFSARRNCYYICWTEDGSDRQRSAATADRREAEIALADFIRSRGQAGRPRDPAEVLITDILGDYAGEHGPDTSAPWRIAAASKSLRVFWQGQAVSGVTRETCRAYGRARGRSAGTVRRELGVLRAAINHAHREGRITRTVAVHLPERPAARDRWLTRSEAARLVAGALGYTFACYSDVRTRKVCWRMWDRERAYARLHLPLFILIGLYAGARKDAILSLRWTQVDLDAARIDFNAPGGRRTNKRRARIPVTRKLLPHLRRAKRRGSDIGFVVSETGKRLGDVKRAFASACRRAGLTGVSPHVLRHTCATWLMQRGVPMWEAAGFLGMTRETLERVYGHHHPDYLETAAEALS
jgi:integrase